MQFENANMTRLLHFCFGSILAVSLIVGAAVPGQDSADSDEIIVRPNYRPGIFHDLTDRLVDTTLHQYDSAKLRRFVTTGESITFRFQAAYYTRYDNVQGGPQYQINLLLDDLDMEPIEPRLQSTEQYNQTELQRQKRLNLEARRLRVYVFSSLALSGGANIFKVERHQMTHVGVFCGLEMYVDPVDKSRNWTISQNPKPLAYPFSSADTFVSVERHKGRRQKDDYYLTLECSSDSRVEICIADSYFKSWAIRFHLRRERLCQWRDQLTRVQAFLASHVVSETPPR